MKKWLVCMLGITMLMSSSVCAMAAEPETIICADEICEDAICTDEICDDETAICDEVVEENVYNAGAGYDVGEPNDSMAQATRMQLGAVYDEELGSYSKYRRDGDTDDDFFVVALEANKTYRLTLDGYYAQYAKTTAILQIYDPKDEYISTSYDMKRKGIDYYDYTAKYTGDHYIRFYNYFDLSGKKDHYYTISINDKNNPVKVTKPTPTQTPSAGGNSQVSSFVSRLYTVALGRAYDNAGLNDWTNKLVSKTMTGAEVARGFFFSDEFVNKNLSDSDYVDTLYRTMFNREADADGKAGWLAALANGMSREFVFRGFAEGAEFKNLCDSFGINQGTVTLTQNRDKNQQLTAFVARNYTKALGRTAEEAGLNDWTGRILGGKATPADVTAGFIFSAEFAGKNLSNEDFLKVLYQTYFDREPDAGGFNGWMEQLNNGATREYVVNTGFSCSAEFANLVKSFGL